MDELLKKLLAADILTESTKVELEAAFRTKLDEAIQDAKTAAQVQVTAELNEQWISERETLIDALDVKVTEALSSELDELKHDINSFRDLEVEYGEKLVEAKVEMANVLKRDLANLIEQMDAFFEVRLTAELNELREDMAIVKRNEFGKKIFEAFIDEFKSHYAEDDSIEHKLSEAELRLEDALTALEESEKKSARLQRSIKMEKVLTPLSGRSKEVMEAILKNVDTSLIEDAYSTYIGRVLKETSEPEKTTNLTESTKTKKEVKGTAKTGNDNERLITESLIAAQDKKGNSTISNAEIARYQAIAGISR